MSDDETTAKQEIIFVPDPEILESTAMCIPAECAPCTCQTCRTLEEHSEAALAARSDVIRVTGFSAALMPVLYLVLTWIDALVNRVRWAPDERILLVYLGVLGAIGAFYWRSKK